MKAVSALPLLLLVGCSGGQQGKSEPVPNGGGVTGREQGAPLAASYKGRRLDEAQGQGNVPTSVLEVLGDARLDLDLDSGTFLLAHEGHVLTGAFRFDPSAGVLALDVTAVDDVKRSGLDSIDLAANKAAHRYPDSESALSELRELMLATDWRFALEGGKLVQTGPEGASPRYAFDPSP